MNTVLGEPSDDAGDQASSHVLASRYEKFKATVPRGVGVLTRSVDVQGDRLETMVYGWGAGTECWPVEFELIPGDPSLPEKHPNSPWKVLSEMLPRTYTHELGFEMRPSVTFIDSGGHHTNEVYQFCRPRQAARVFAIKGANTEGAPLLSKPSRISHAKVILYHVGVWTAKETLIARLVKVKEAGQGYIHIPVWLDGEQLSQLTAEKVITKRVGGYPHRSFIKTHDRNEQMDLWAYAYAAVHQLGALFVRDLEKHVAKLAAEHDKGALPPGSVSAGPTSKRKGRRVLSKGIL